MREHVSRLAEEMAFERADDAAVGDDEDLLARREPAAIRRSTPTARASNASLASPSWRSMSGEALLDLRPREAAPRADVDLAQVGVGGDLEPFRAYR